MCGPNAVVVNGAVLHRAQKDKKTCPFGWSFRLSPADVGVTKLSGSSTHLRATRSRDAPSRL